MAQGSGLRARLATGRSPPPASEQLLQCWRLPLHKLSFWPSCTSTVGGLGTQILLRGSHSLEELDNEQLTQEICEIRVYVWQSRKATSRGNGG